MISADNATLLRAEILNQLILQQQLAVEKERDRLCVANFEKYGQDTTRYGFLVGSQMHIHSGVQRRDMRLIKRQAIHPSLNSRAMVMHARSNEINNNTILIRQALTDLIREGDDFQHVRDVLPDHLISFLNMPISLPARSTPEGDIEKMGASGANFTLLRKFSDDLMIHKLLKD